MNEKSGEAERYTVIFDGDCPLCRGSVEALRVRDLEGILDFVPGQEPGIEENYPGISRDAASAAIHLVSPDGEIWQGAGAVEELARILPGFRWLRGLFALPFARRLAGPVYRIVARNRKVVRNRKGAGDRMGAPPRRSK
jgi:predicted DCC family thiol-disulfide oxidoreductase YuxK